MSYDNFSSVSQNVLKFYQQLTDEERRIPFIFDDFHICCFGVIGLDMTENRICIRPSRDRQYYVIGYGGRAGIHTGFRTITLVPYIRSLPHLATCFPCGRGRT